MKPIYGQADGFTVELDTGVYRVVGELDWLEFEVSDRAMQQDALTRLIPRWATQAIEKSRNEGKELEYLGRQTQRFGDDGAEGCLVFARPGAYVRIGPMEGGAAVSVRTPAEWHIEANDFLCGARGVIHIGANNGEECRIYGAMELPAIFVEPLNEPFAALLAETAKYPNQRAFQYLLTDIDGQEYDFGIANNGGQSSSIFEFGDHAKLWPDVYFVDSVKLKSTTLKTMIGREGINIADYDAMVIDVQCAELLVLQGAGDLLDAFRWIRCETADFEVYKGGCQMADLDAFLAARGFNRVKTIKADGLPDVGYAYEAIYERNST